MKRDIKREFEEMLELQGGLYTFEDVLELINEGKFQSFVTNDTWLVTQVHQFPRKKVVDVVFVIGDMKDLPELEAQMLAFKDSIGADYLSATGRLGWKKNTLPGWKAVSMNFLKV